MEAHSPNTQAPIGVIIPTYNRADVLITCLQHLEAQTWRDFEVVIVDDGSTDSTRRLVEQYRETSPLRIRFLSQPNSGPATARNVAIRSLEAPICLMIGDDILASPELVKIHLELHRRNPEPFVAAVGLTRWSDSGQRITPFMRWLDEGGLQFAYHDLHRNEPPDWKHFYTSNLSLKTAFLREHPFNEVFTNASMEDIELGYRLEVLHGLKMTFLPDAVAHHLHPTSFRQACRRMRNVGISSRQFHQLWPEWKPPTGSWLRRTVRSGLAKNAWILSPLRLVADALTRIWCPNPLMKGVLRGYYAVGYLEQTNGGSKSL